jgi:DinB superfamily
MYECVACGFSFDLHDAEGAGGRIVERAREVVVTLRSRPEAELRARPDATTWSPIEYGCHVRDVLLVQRERLLLARRTDCPEPEKMGREERVEHDGYASQDPANVARQLEDAATLFANVLARLEPPDWERVLVYNYPGRMERTLRWVAVHTLHEVVHHAADIDAQLSS